MLGAPLWLVAVSLFASSVVIASTSVAWETFLQSRVERDALPSVFALDYLAGDGVAPLGYVAVPALAVWLGQDAGVLNDRWGMRRGAAGVPVGVCRFYGGGGRRIGCGVIGSRWLAVPQGG